MRLSPFPSTRGSTTWSYACFLVRSAMSSRLQRRFSAVPASFSVVKPALPPASSKPASFAPGPSTATIPAPRTNYIRTNAGNLVSTSRVHKPKTSSYQNRQINNKYPNRKLNNVKSSRSVCSSSSSLLNDLISLRLYSWHHIVPLARSLAPRSSAAILQ